MLHHQRGIYAGNVSLLWLVRATWRTAPTAPVRKGRR